MNSKKLTKETFDLLSSEPDWKHTGVYGTYFNPKSGRFACEISRMWSNVCYVIALTTKEKRIVETDNIIPAGEHGSMMMLKEQIAIYEQSNSTNDCLRGQP